MNPSGENGLVRKNRPLLLAMLLMAFLAACAVPAPAPEEDREVQQRVREPAQQQKSGVQVYPLQNPAVKFQMAQFSINIEAGII